MNPFIADIISITWPLIIIFIAFTYMVIKDLFNIYTRIIEELDND